jgi:hypothetical protein
LFGNFSFRTSPIKKKEKGHLEAAEKGFLGLAFLGIAVFKYRTGIDWKITNIFSVQLKKVKQ